MKPYRAGDRVVVALNLKDFVGCVAGIVRMIDGAYRPGEVRIEVVGREWPMSPHAYALWHARTGTPIRVIPGESRWTARTVTGLRSTTVEVIVPKRGAKPKPPEPKPEARKYAPGVEVFPTIHPGELSAFWLGGIQRTIDEAAFVLVGKLKPPSTVSLADGNPRATIDRWISIYPALTVGAKIRESLQEIERAGVDIPDRPLTAMERDFFTLGYASRSIESRRRKLDRDVQAVLARPDAFPPEKLKDLATEGGMLFRNC
jgi:hypothetical protein